MRSKLPRGVRQRENLTPEVPSEDQRTSQDSESRSATLICINSINSITQTYGYPQKGKCTIPLEAKAGVIYQLPCKGCNAKNVGETSKTLKTTMAV